MSKFRPILFYFMRFFYFILLFSFLGCQSETPSFKLNQNEDIYYLDGKPYTGVVIDKLKSGRVLKSFYCINGKIDGVYLQYYKNGRLYLKQHYSNGKLNGVSKQFQSNGAPQFFQTYKNGELDGKQIIYPRNVYFNKNEKFNPELIYTLKNGQLDGYYMNEDDFPYCKGHYKNGKMTGKCCYYSYDGIIGIGHFKNGNGTNLGATGIPRNGRIGKWILYDPPFTKIQNYRANSEWFEFKSYKNGKLVYFSKVNTITEEEIVYLNKL